MKTPRVLESAIERKVVAWAKKQGIFQTKLVSPGNRSLPDRIFWVPGGKPLMIEFKRPGGEATELQKAMHSKLESLGYEVKVFDNADVAIQWIWLKLPTVARFNGKEIKLTSISAESFSVNTCFK